MSLSNFRLFLDGAHTNESIAISANWFKGSTLAKTAKWIGDKRAKKMLIFNVTGKRGGNDMLNVLHQHLAFDLALFVPNVVTMEMEGNR